MLSRYRGMSESVHHDEQCSSLHDRWCFRYDEQCSSLHAEGLKFFYFSANKSHDCLVSIVNNQCAWKPKNHSLTPGEARRFSLLQSVQTSCRAYPAQAKCSKGQYLWKKGNKDVGNKNKNLFQGLLHKATDRCLTHNLMNVSQQTWGKLDCGNWQLKTRTPLAFRKQDCCKNLQIPSIFCLY